MADYLRATRSRKVEGIVWHEFIADEPFSEMAWAEKLAEVTDVPIALVGLVDFADPALSHRLDVYSAVPNLTAVRQHLGWDKRKPFRRMASRADFLTDPAWLNGLDSLKGHDLRCGLEVFGPRLPQLLPVVLAYPDITLTSVPTATPSGS